MPVALCAIAWAVLFACAMSFGVWLGGGNPLLNPFASLLGMVASPFIFWMGVAASGVPVTNNRVPHRR